MPVAKKKRPEKSCASLSSKEEDVFNDLYEKLSPSQVKAAQLESTGTTDLRLIASHVEVTTRTISNWRNDEDYKKLISLQVAIIDRISREQRIAFAKQIVAPALAELMKRMSDPKEIKVMATKDLVTMIEKINKEIRMDSTVATDNSENSNEIAELQRRRKHLLAEQAVQVEKLKNNNNILEFPKQVVSNG